MRRIALGAAFAVAAVSPALADGPTIAKYHAPIGVMGDHMHDKGEVMFSYRFMRMEMEGSRIGTDSVSPETIVTTVPNRFFGRPMQPPTLRVAPLRMTMDMHMLGAMYAPTDWLTLMAMGMLVDKEMDHVTFQGASGTTELGAFRTKTFGIGDMTVGGLVRLFDSAAGGIRHRAHLNLALSLPSGSISETGEILTPTGATPRPRLPYPMQLGSGTFDLKPGATYTGASDAFSWGAQYLATVRTGNNGEGYTLGDRHEATAWAQWGPAPSIAFSSRIAFSAADPIEGADPAIVAPVQTGDPDFQGGDRLDVGLGVNLAGQRGAAKGHRLAAEILFPIYQDLNGPQLETDWTLTIGWQKAF
ncbi:MAG: transporter [Amphiplicatus sp.]